jgi:hypothetical protein
MKPHLVVLWMSATMALPTAAQSASVTATPQSDNTLYAESDTLSNGAGQRFFAGRSGQNFTRRALIKFNLSGLIPAGATVDSVVMRLNLAQTSSGTQTLRIHRVLADWGEGISAGVMGEGSGAPATANDATWAFRFYGAAQAWLAPGGDYTPAASASRPVGAALGFYSWRSTGMTSDVAFWLQNPSSNFGWELIGNETDAASAKAFNSRQAISALNRPLLTVYYTEAPTGTAPLSPAARLFPVHPNPFNPAATIRYSVPAATRVRLAVYDVRGRLLRVLTDGMVTAGTHESVWRGEDVRGTRVASGVYLVRLESEHAPAQTEKMVLLK